MNPTTNSLPGRLRRRQFLRASAGALLTTLLRPSPGACAVDDWLAAIAEQREPECSGRNAAQAIELVMAVYHAALTGRRVPFPLTVRGHPLAAGQR